MSLVEEFEDATSTQPYTDRPAAIYIAAGRRARARRRAALGGGAAAVVLFAAGAVTVGSQTLLSDSRPNNVATQGPKPVAPSSNAQVYRDMAVTGAHAGYDNRTGELVLDHGWHVTERLDSPWQTGAFGEPTLPTRSVALAVSDGTHVQWILLDWEAGAEESGAIYDDDPGARGFSSLAAYVDVSMARRAGSSTDELVAFSGPETLEPRNGITITTQESVTLGDGTRAVLAQLEVLDNPWYVVARRTAQGPTYVPVAYPLEGDAPGLPGLLAHVNELVANGGLE
jgi:hypothetical protein